MDRSDVPVPQDLDADNEEDFEDAQVAAFEVMADFRQTLATTLANRGLDRLWPNRLWPILGLKC